MTWEIRDKVCVVTGANTGIGRATAEALARRGAHVLLTARTREKAQPVVEAIIAATGNRQVEGHALELGSLAAVQRSADALLARDLPLHVLINNAGVASQTGCTADGFELHFGVNHLGHFLWTTRLLPRLRASGSARIVNVSSNAHYQARRGIDFDRLRQSASSPVSLQEYAVSKLANILFTQELSRRFSADGIASFSLHPGVIASEIWRPMPRPVAWILGRVLASTDRGAQTSVYCATEPGLEAHSGRYFAGRRLRRESRRGRDSGLAQTLWARSESMIAEALAASGQPSQGPGADRPGAGATAEKRPAREQP